MKYQKLVRDKIEKILRKKGQTPIVHIASSDEYYKGLKAKLQEEVEEFTKSNNIEELADLLEVIYAICEHKGISRDTLNNLRRQKNEERGKFINRVILEKVEH